MNSNTSTELNVADWLQSIGMEQYTPGFVENHITGDTLRDLTDLDLKECGILVMGHRKHVLAAIRELNGIPNPGTGRISTLQPRKLGHFELLEPIGQGGIGTVYRAWDSSLNRQVALKLLDRDLASNDPQFLQDFIREAHSAASLNHPNIVQIYFAGEEGGEYYIVTELLEGQNMADRIKRGPMDEKMVLRIARQVVEALAVTNSRRLIHGDIKPHNIFITQNGDTKLLDFGLARKTTIRPAEGDSFVGSAVYVSPERVLSQPEDFRSDIYSLGATLFEALSGLVPFDAESPADVAMKRLQEEAPRLRSVKPTASLALEKLLAGMMARDVNQRPESYDVLLEQIKAAENALLTGFDPGKKFTLGLPPEGRSSARVPTQSLPAGPAMPAMVPMVAPHSLSATATTVAPLPVTPKLSRWKRFSSSKFFLVSIGVHLLIGLVATVLVVQTITTKRKIVFKGEPPAKNPNRNTTEHTVKMVKKQQTMSAPQQPRRVTTTNAMAKVSLPEMPAISSPGAASNKMGGVGGLGPGFSPSGGAGSGVGGGGGLNMFGMKGGVGLIGTFYDLKQDKNKKPTEMTIPKYVKKIESFVGNNWNESQFESFFKGPTRLSTAQIMIPDMEANNGPKAFELEKDVLPSMWLVLYKGVVVPPDSGTYNFVGRGDDILMVRFAGKLVLDGNWHGINMAKEKEVNIGYKPTGTYDYQWPSNDGYANPAMRGKLIKGDPFQVNAGVSYPIEILIGEQPGGRMHTVLLIEQKGATYKTTSTGAPILPPFRLNRVKMAPLQRGQTLPPFDGNGPIWQIKTSPLGNL